MGGILLLNAQENVKTEIKENMEMPVLAETGNPSQFRGTNCSGVAPAGAHPPVCLLPEENLAWKTEIASDVSSPCVWENSIFLTGVDPYDRKLTTYHIDKETGTILWEKSVLPDSIETVHPVGSFAAATPATDGKHVYVYFGSYGIVCYDFEGNQVYMISNGGLTTCMNTETGEVIYREKLGAPEAFIASPLLAGGHIYFVSYNGRITVVKPDDKLNVVSQCNLKEKIAAADVVRVISQTDPPGLICNR